MAATHERWWDPRGPGVDLLSPGGDVQLDTANALVAIHRAGAAALLDAAGTPLVDDQTVVNALVCAREAYAEPVRKALGASLRDATYAGLLVGDIADEAEQAALRLYRVAVSKGVAPPIAAQRAAAVYAVPARALGIYAKMAVDPNAKDVALLDAGDRALFGWVGKAVAQELDMVSKAETLEVRRAASATQPRDHGRFATADVDEQATLDALELQLMSMGPEVATEPAKPKAQPRRLQRVRRVKRMVRVKPTEEVAQRTAATRTPAQRKVAARNAATIAAAEAQVQESKSKALVPVVTEGPLELGNMAHLAGSVVLPRLDQDVTYVMTTGQWQMIHSASVNDASKRWNLSHPGASMYKAETILSARALDRATSATAAIKNSDQHSEALRDARDAMRQENPALHPDVLADPEVMELDDADVDALAEAAVTSLGHYYELRDKIIAKMMRRFIQKEDRIDINPNVEVANVQLMRDYHQPDQMLWVWQPPGQDNASEDPNQPRPTAAVVELTIDGKNLHGEVTPASRALPETVDLDPNQLIDINGYDPHGIAGETRFDRLTGLRRIQLRGEVIDPNDTRFSKAETLERRRAAIVDEPRSHGRFATAEQMPKVDLSDHSIQTWLQGEQRKAATRSSSARTVRRVNRIKRRAPSTTTSTVASQTAAQRAVAQRTGAERVTRSRRELAAASSSVAINAAVDDPEVLPLVDGDDYTVMSAAEAKSQLGITEHTKSLDLGLRESGSLYSPTIHHTAVDTLLATGEAVRTTAGTTAGIAGDLLHTGRYDQTEMGLEQMLADYEAVAGHGRKGGPLASTEVRLERYTDRGRAKIRMELRDSTDYASQTANVFVWDTHGGAEGYHSIHHLSSYLLLSRAATRSRVAGLWRELERRDRYAETIDYVENPTVDLWTITDTPRPNGASGR